MKICLVLIAKITKIINQGGNMRWKYYVMPLLALSIGSIGYSFELTGKVKEFTLDNGLRVLYMERHTSPTIAFRTLFLSGSADEPSNKIGLAHLIEHMMFKGTKTFGTKDYEKECPLLTKLDAIYSSIEIEKKKTKSDSMRLNKLTAEFDSTKVLAREYIKQREISEIYGKNGGVGLNAGTSKDYTMYMVELPSNKLELWARITADIMENTVFRGFYEEKDVVSQEVRMHEDEPGGKLYDEFFKTAFKVHPYGKSIAGNVEVIAGISINDLKKFYNKHYIPGNGVIAIVGDIDSEQVKSIVTKYFAHIPKRNLPERTIPVEPPQTSERRIELRLDAEPRIMIGYHIPTYPNPDIYPLEMLGAVLSDGRVSILNKKMIQTKLAASASAFTGAPGRRYPNLFMFLGSPITPHTTAEIESTLYVELEKIKTTPVSDWELKRIKNNIKAGLMRSLSDNSAIASQLTYYEGFRGGWEKLGEYVEKLNNVTAQDIMRVAKKYLTKENRTVATLIKKGNGAPIMDIAVEYYEKKTGKKIDEETLGKLKALINQIDETEKAGGKTVPKEQKLQIIYQVLDRVITN